MAQAVLCKISSDAHPKAPKSVIFRRGGPVIKFSCICQVDAYVENEQLVGSWTRRPERKAIRAEKERAQRDN